MPTITFKNSVSEFNFSDANSSYSFFKTTSVTIQSLPSPSPTADSSDALFDPLPRRPPPPSVEAGGEAHLSPAQSIHDFVHDKLRTQNLPPILYRAYTDRSRGINSKEESAGFQSEYMKENRDRVILEDMTLEDFRDSVVHHIENVTYFEFPAQESFDWQKKKGKQKKPKKPKRVSMQSIWLSTSGSLLSTLQRAQWMSQRGFTNVTIAAIDTGSFRKPEFVDKMEFICSVPELCQYLGHTEKRQYIKFNCNEEYLVLNQLRCKTSHIPFNDLYNGGIRFILPDLEKIEVHKYIGEGLVELRKRAFSQVFPLSPEEIECCRKLTRFFFTGQRCNLVFYALLALKRRPKDDPAIDGIVKHMMRGWRNSAAFHSNGQVRIDNLLRFRFEFDFTRPRGSTHEEIVQFAEIGQRLTRHNQAYEKEIGRKIMEKIWGNFNAGFSRAMLITFPAGEYGDGITRLDARLHNDRSAKGLLELLMRRRREVGLWTFENICANEDIRRKVVNDIEMLRKWTQDVNRNKPTSVGAMKARIDRADRKAAPLSAYEW
ncbi:hypothetical protein H2200_005496 [Cladophialophora chaetospira]|uniref:Uncharacterized protein n=1 Tax=Cladophialophora chaetospira TaxID=386627 RepID=A0AA38XC66_9EURO|nr:hypothetical protein H2200_005496 [Cladophialophora chaetospira]